MKFLRNTLLIMLSPFISFAQQHPAHFNFGLIRYIQSLNDPQAQLQLLVQGNTSEVQAAINACNGRIKYSVNNFSSVTIPASQLNTLLYHQGVERVEGYHGFGKTMDDETDIHTNVTAVHNGNSPLLQGYDGEDVVMGIIDTGIDFLHPDFQDSTGNTRILYIWDQTVDTGGTTPTFGYGQEWSSTDIDAGNCTHNEASQYYGHGSNVSGAAAGNGLAIGKYAGVAPQAQIISVSVDMGNNMLNNIADAVQYIFDHADQLDMPASISASVGTYMGSHDGADLPAQMINQLIAAQNGRSMSASAGNAGSIQLHLGYDVEPDSAYTWFRYEASISRVYYELWARKDQFDNVQFSLGADLPNPTYAKRGATQYYNVLNDFNLTNGLDSVTNTLYSTNGNPLGDYTIYVNDYNDSTYQVVVQVLTDSTTYVWRFTTKGSGRIDCWSHPLYTGTSNMVKTNLPDTNVYTDFLRYRMPDRIQNLVSSFQCSDHVITVANYTNRTQFPNYYNDTTYYLTDTTGARALSSSIGPTRDNRIKPDITAPGAYTLAPGQLSTIAVFIANSNNKVAEGGYHNVNGGTSMSSPVVGGIVALYLQKNPNASWQEIKDAIIMSAIQDQFTGSNLPDTKWGYGKIDAFGMMLSQIIYGCTDTGALNYDPTATIDDSSCLYDVIIPIVDKDVAFALYPNPSTNSVYLYCTSTDFSAPCVVEITDAIGRVVYTVRFYDSNDLVKVDVSNWQNGLYLCKLSQHGKTVRTVKFGKL